MIVADLPAGDRPQVRRVQLVAPTSTDERLALAAAQTDGWLYLVTLTGTTGARSELSPALAGLAFTGDADGLPLVDAGGDFDGDDAVAHLSARAAARRAVVADHGALAAAVGAGSDHAEHAAEALLRDAPLPAALDADDRRADR